MSLSRFQIYFLNFNYELILVQKFAFIPFIPQNTSCNVIILRNHSISQNEQMSHGTVLLTELNRLYLNLTNLSTKVLLLF